VPAIVQGTWGAALGKAAAQLIACYALLLYVPNRLLAFLATRVTPNVRDAIVLAWEVVFFLVLAWLFVALQRGRRARP